jgi:hypothetical protein
MKFRMNNNLRELVDNAGAYTDVSGRWISSSGLQKFAELIVRECADIADRERPNYLGCGYITHTKGQEIKEYFGVEE